MNTILNPRQQNLNNLHQNLDKTILDLIAHQNSGVWCVSVVQLVALVYKVPILIIDMANKKITIWQVVDLEKRKADKVVLSRTSM